MSKPTCVFCGRSGSGVQFNIFTPRFQPFGTACVECEEKLPPGTVVPARPVVKLDLTKPPQRRAGVLRPLRPSEDGRSKVEGGPSPEPPPASPSSILPPPSSPQTFPPFRAEAAPAPAPVAPPVPEPTPTSAPAPMNTNTPTPAVVRTPAAPELPAFAAGQIAFAHEGFLYLRLPLQTPTPSSTGKTLVVASTHGNATTTATVAGKPVIVGINAYIKP